MLVLVFTSFSTPIPSHSLRSPTSNYRFPSQTFIYLKATFILQPLKSRSKFLENSFYFIYHYSHFSSTNQGRSLGLGVDFTEGRKSENPEKTALTASTIRAPLTICVPPLRTHIHTTTSRLFTSE